MRAFSDGRVVAQGTVTQALGLAPTGTVAAYEKYTGGPARGDRFYVGAMSSSGVVWDLIGDTPSPPSQLDIVGDGSIAIVRGGVGMTWKLEHTTLEGSTTTPIDALPPLAWNGDVFITEDTAGDVVYYDTSLQPVVTRPGAGPATTFTRVAATKRRALFVFVGGTPGAVDVQYVQICL